MDNDVNAWPFVFLTVAGLFAFGWILWLIMKENHRDGP